MEEITDYSVGRVIRSDVTEWKRSRITVLVVIRSDVTDWKRSRITVLVE